LLVVEDLDVVEEVLLGLGVALEPLAELELQRREPALHRSVVVAVATPAHAALDAVRHPVSTSFSSRGLLVGGGGGEGASSGVLGWVVGDALLPAGPEDAAPGASEDPASVGMVAAAITCALVEGRSPGRGLARAVGETGERGAQALVARPAEADGAVFAGLAGDGRDAGLGGEVLRGSESDAVVAELREDLGGADAAGAEERGDDLAVGVGLDGVLDGGGERLDLSDERAEDGDEGADTVAPGLGLHLSRGNRA